MNAQIEQPTVKVSRGLGIAALVVGIAGFVLAFIPYFGLILCLVGVGLGIAAVAKKQPKGLAITGLALASVGVIFSLLWSISFTAFMGASTSEIEASPASTESEIEAVPEEPVETTPDLTTFGELDERTLALIAKDPAAYEGTNAIVYGKVTQFDSFTGKCGMRLSLGHTVLEHSYDYEHNTMAISGDAESNCPVLDPIVQDDIVKLWVTVLGAYNYDTTIGGTATAIAVEVWQAEVLPRPEY